MESDFDPRLDTPPPFFEQGGRDEVRTQRAFQRQVAPPPPPLPRRDQRQRADNDNGWGVAGFVLALLSWMLCWIPGLSMIMGVLGLIFSCIGLSKRPRAFALAGFIISIAGFLLFILMVFVIGIAIAGNL